MKYTCNRAPMGWNSYDYYDTTVTETDVIRNAEWMKAHLLSSGYEYVVIDIEWYAKDAGTRRKEWQYIPFGDEEMDEYGRLLPDQKRFPSSAGGNGFKTLADRIHSMGLKFGIHIMRGIPRAAAHNHLPVYGCDGITADLVADPFSISKWNPDMYGVRKDVPGAYEYYKSIIDLYASWGVDFIKCDDICNTNMYPHDPYSAAHEIEYLARAIEESGRDIVLSLSPGPALFEHADHYDKYANMWRITDDFWDKWELLKDMFSRCHLWEGKTHPGSFPDCDMLTIGMLGKGFGGDAWHTHFTSDEVRTMLTLWCVFGSPLMIGSELELLNEEEISVLTDPVLMKIHSCDFTAKEERLTGDEAVWSTENKTTGEKYYALFNISEIERTVEIDAISAKLKPHGSAVIPAK